MSKHTPGPWFQGTGDYAYCVYDKRVQVNPDGSRSGDTPNLVVVVSPEDAIADARLIAAAPDLLEALQEMVAGDAEAIEEAEKLGVPFPEELLTTYRKARAAIAKATGAAHVAAPKRRVIYVCPVCAASLERQE